MKTPKEVKAAVLKECERLCPNIEPWEKVLIPGNAPVRVWKSIHVIHPHGVINLGVPMAHDTKEVGFSINCYGMMIRLWSGSTDQDWTFAYRLLGITDADRFLPLSAETLIMMREDLLLNIAISLDDSALDKAELKLVEWELDRRTRGGMSSIHSLMGYLLEKEATNV